MARFVLLAARPVGEKDERASDCASFWTHFYFTGWGKHDLHRTIWGDVKLLRDDPSVRGLGQLTGQCLRKRDSRTLAFQAGPHSENPTQALSELSMRRAGPRITVAVGTIADRPPDNVDSLLYFPVL